MTSSPVLMIVFNRPAHARTVLDKVRLVKPSRLYIAVDGPRADRPQDADLVKQTIALFKEVDWPCEVKTLIREKNLGCKIAVSSAITWFFDQEEQGIILEDDCVPDASFFSFCDNLLEKYKHTDTIMHINGVNFQDGNWRGPGTYYFSKVCHVWGWASWRRAWKKYDINMSGLDEFLDPDIFYSVLDYKGCFEYWQPPLISTQKGLIDTWDYQWVFSIWKNNGLVIMPNINLISNIGFDAAATHTHKVDPRVSNKPLVALNGNIDHPSMLIAHREGDLYSFNKLFTYETSFVSKVKKKIHSLTGI